MTGRTSAPAAGAEPLLAVDGLRKHYRVRKSAFRRATQDALVVDDVSFSISARETWGLVGESGSGKSTTARLVLRLVEPTAGSIKLDGEELTALKGRALRRQRTKMQAVFQDVAGSLDSKMTVAQIVTEPLRYHGPVDRADRLDRARELLERVGLGAAHLDRYPYELSGGQRQRVALARALAVQPRLLVLDEAVSALDVSTRAQIINLLAELRTEFGMAYLFIAHDLSVVHHLCDRIAVMYLGQIVESGPADAVYLRPRHPYTQALLSAIPTTDTGRERIVLHGDTPSITQLPSGCRFHTRCAYAFEPCATIPPPLITWPDGGAAACHLHTQGPRLAGGSINTVAESAKAPATG